MWLHFHLTSFSWRPTTITDRSDRGLEHPREITPAGKKGGEEKGGEGRGGSRSEREEEGGGGEIKGRGNRRRKCREE